MRALSLRSISAACLPATATLLLPASPFTTATNNVGTVRFSSTFHRGGKCPFVTLGLTKSASRLEVKIRYKKLAKEYHPDCGGCEQRFKDVHAAYVECNRQIDEREFNEKYGTKNGSNGARTGNTDADASAKYEQRHKERYYNASGSSHENDSGPNQGFGSEHYRSDPDNIHTDAQRRVRLCQLFETAATADEVDELLQHCLTSRVFDSIDIGEPLLRALGRYHVNTHLGLEHVQHCFAAINRWEDWHRKRAPQSYYHPILIIYCDPIAGAHNNQSDIAEGVTAVLEEIEAKGYIPDDWCISLANRVFRTSPCAW